MCECCLVFFFSSRRRHTRYWRDWSSDVCSSDLARVDELVELMGLGAFADKFVAELSTGSRRIVDLACILAHEPDVLLFDEPRSEERRVGKECRSRWSPYH